MDGQSARPLTPALGGIVADQGHNHAVQVEEEHDQVEDQFDVRFLGQKSQNCVWSQKTGRGNPSHGGIHTFLWTLSLRKISVASSIYWFSRILSSCEKRGRSLGRAICPAGRREAGNALLLNVPCKERQVQDQRHPVSIDEEQQRQEAVDGSFGNDVCVEAITEIDRVDVVTGEDNEVRCRAESRESLSLPTPQQPSCHWPTTRQTGVSRLREAARGRESNEGGGGNDHTIPGHYT